VDGKRWRRLHSVDDLLHAGPRSAVFVLNEQTGTVQFGDGRKGRRRMVEFVVTECRQ
jgi:hypothetical protein